MTGETFLQMAERHYKADGMLARGSCDWDGKSACSVGCFNHDLGNRPGDFAALAEFSGYPEWAHRIQEALFEGLPEPDNRKWHVQFARKAESVTDWNAALKATMIGVLEVALPHDTSEGQVVQRVLDLYHRDDVSPDEWAAAEAAARDEDTWVAAVAAAVAATVAAGAAAARAAARNAAPDTAARAAARAAGDEAYPRIRDAFLNA